MKPAEVSRLPGSFRDPSGFLFCHEGRLYRQVNQRYAPNYDLLRRSGLWDRLVQDGFLIEHDETDLALAVSPEAYKVLAPKRIPFISYPYEWCFGQWKDAALLTLKIQKMALDRGMSLKDASAFNVQFLDGKPLFIDTLSFESYREDTPWVAYRQFCQHFLIPLALMSFKDIRLARLMRLYLDGIPLDLGSRLLPLRTYGHLSLMIHIHLHARSQSHFSNKTVAPSGAKMSKLGLLGLIDSLETAVRKLGWKPEGTEWADYDRISNYSESALEQKKTTVAQYLEKINPSSVWDFGANTGHFSRLASEKSVRTVAFDNDPAAVEKNYRTVVERKEKNLLPLLIDLANPSPGLGWAHEERMSLVKRGPADAVFALALIHHLALSNNLPFDAIAEFLSRVGQWLVIEFIPKSDSQVKRLLSLREDIFDRYTQRDFEETFSSRFEIQDRKTIEGSGRTLYLMKKK